MSKTSTISLADLVRSPSIGMMKMKSSPPMCPTKPSSPQTPFTTSCRILREDPDDPVAVVVPVPVVEFLEVIEVRVAHRELLARRRGVAPISASISIVPGSRVDGWTHEVAVGPAQHRVEPRSSLRWRPSCSRTTSSAPARERRRERRRVVAGQHDGRHDAGVRVALEPAARAVHRARIRRGRRTQPPAGVPGAKSPSARRCRGPAAPRPPAAPATR